jgi:hypothetical protein
MIQMDQYHILLPACIYNLHCVIVVAVPVLVSRSFVKLVLLLHIVAIGMAIGIAVRKTIGKAVGKTVASIVSGRKVRRCRTVIVRLRLHNNRRYLLFNIFVGSIIFVPVLFSRLNICRNRCRSLARRTWLSNPSSLGLIQRIFWGEFGRRYLRLVVVFIVFFGRGLL